MATSAKRKTTTRKAKSRTVKRRKRDVTKDYPLSQFIAKIRRLADSLESNKRFNIQVAGQRVLIPGSARINVEHEVGEDEEELEFQLVWSLKEEAPLSRKKQPKKSAKKSTKKSKR